jgi:hypothetical protein
MGANAKLTGTYCYARFCVFRGAQLLHKNERSSMCPRAAFC